MGLLCFGLGGGIEAAQLFDEGAAREVFLEFKYAGGHHAGAIVAAKMFRMGLQFLAGVKAVEFILPLLLAGALGDGGVFGLHLPLPALAIGAGLQGAMVVAADLGQLAEDLAEALPAVRRGGFVGEQFSADFDQFDGEEAGEAVADFQAAGVGELGLIFDQGGDPLAGILLAEPIEVAAGLPFGEVLLADGASAELAVEDFADLVRLVEPVDEAFAGFAVLEAAVEFVADGVGETGDFSISCCHEGD
ncbi:MAG: hypothetical protein ABSE16_12970 [Verrucomicrobiota bacterium]